MGYTLANGISKLESYIRKEVKFSSLSKLRSRGNKVKHIQEFLCFHNFVLQIDGDYGPVTENLVRQFQSTKGILNTGQVDEETHNALVEPMTKVLTPLSPPPSTFEAAVAAYARQHLNQTPHEIGGQNQGPWVRMYMEGNDGDAFAWCAGFTQFVMRQAAESLDIDMPIKGSWGCDEFANQAKTKGLWIAANKIDKTQLVPGSLFLALKAPNDYGHIGIITNAGATRIETIEGNTNSSQSNNGHKICAQSRGYEDIYDFIVFNPTAVHVNNTSNDPVQLAAAGAPIDVRRYFYEGLIPHKDFPSIKNQGYVYGSLFNHWGGWITAGHVIYDANFNPPPYAGGSVVFKPADLDAALVGCRLPNTRPENIQEGEPIVICGFPAGSAEHAIRSGVAYMYRAADPLTNAEYGRWIIRIDEPSEPVVSGMSGGVAVNANTGEIVGIITHSNSPGDLDFGNPNPDPEDDHSLDIVSLHDVWAAIKTPRTPPIV